nr:MAG TPA: hypothetical protein [Caudoviricetes sp.]
MSENKFKIFWRIYSSSVSNCENTFEESSGCFIIHNVGVSYPVIANDGCPLFFLSHSIFKSLE